MSKVNNIQLECSSITRVPLNNYCKDFTFIVNGEEFKTSHVISDLLSPMISDMHYCDPTLNTFIINTQEKGNFDQILKLVNFLPNEINEDDIPFIVEVLTILKSDKIKIVGNYFNDEKLTKDNIIEKLQKHENTKLIFHDIYEKDIEFISQHFDELLKTKEDEISKLEVDTLEYIMNNEHLRLDDEDQLFEFVHKLYKIDEVKYSKLFGYVLFKNVSKRNMVEFIKTYDNTYLTNNTWNHLCERLSVEIEYISNDFLNKERYTCLKTCFSPNENSPFTGIIDYFRKQSNSIDDDVEVIASSCSNSDKDRQPPTILLKENEKGYMATEDEQNSWIKLDFKKHRIVPTDYTIRSFLWNQNSQHPKSWVIEVSNDDTKWEIIDEVKDNSCLNGKRLVHTFNIKKQQNKKYRYIRIRQTDKNWCNTDQLVIETIEFYGILYK